MWAIVDSGHRFEGPRHHGRPATSPRDLTKASSSEAASPADGSLPSVEAVREGLSPSASVRVSVTVRDVAGAAIEGAAVLVGSTIESIVSALETETVRASSDSAGVAELEGLNPSTALWLLVTRDSYIPHLEHLATYWESMRDASDCAIAVQLRPPMNMLVQVHNVAHFPIENALVSARTAWGSEARELQTGLNAEILANLLAPSARTDPSGLATIPVRSIDNYVLSVTHQEYAPLNMSLSSDTVREGRVFVTLDQVLVAPIRILGLPDPLLATIVTEDYSAGLWGDSDWLGVQLSPFELASRFLIPRQHCFYARARKDPSTPLVGQFVITGLGSSKVVLAPYVPVATVGEADVVAVDLSTEPSQYGSVRVQVRDGQGAPCTPQFEWSLLQLDAVHLHRELLPTTVDRPTGLLTWSSVPPGTWRVWTFVPSLAQAESAGHSLPVFDVEEGRESAIDLVEPRLDLIQCHLEVQDTLGRRLRHYRAVLHSEDYGYLVVHRGTRLVPEGHYELIMDALGYESLVTNVYLSQEGGQTISVRLRPRSSEKTE